MDFHRVTWMMSPGSPPDCRARRWLSDIPSAASSCGNSWGNTVPRRRRSLRPHLSGGAPSHRKAVPSTTFTLCSGMPLPRARGTLCYPQTCPDAPFLPWFERRRGPPVHRPIRSSRILPAFLEMTFHRSDHDTMPGITMLVQGGSIDHIVPPAELQRLAEAYRAECHVFPGMAHDLMLDEGWEDPKRCWSGSCGCRRPAQAHPVPIRAWAG